jgi:two-component system response regulator HydG
VPHEEEQSTLLQAPRLLDDPNVAYVIDVVSPDIPPARQVIDPATPTVLAGTSPACAIRVQDHTVSRRHCAFELDGVSLRLCDLGSTNGTFIGSVRIDEAHITSDEYVTIGATQLRVQRTTTATRPPPVASFGGLIGASRAMRALYPLCERLSNADIPVVIEGETGTGKEVLAEALHALGPRAAKPFVLFDCTAVLPSLMESELFGHEKGAFTGAVSARKGVFEQAAGGTLFIDEVGDLDLALQAKLLRAIERSQVRRVGGDRWMEVDVRILAATRRNLDREVQMGRFRDDLFHRLAVGRIELPPLRRRTGDVRVLAETFCEQMGAPPTALDEALLTQWESDAWPGNVRELRNAVARRLTLGALEQTRADPEENPADADSISAVLELRLPLVEARQRVVDSFERRYVRFMLERSAGNVVRAAAASGVARRYFQILKARFGA